ncbi:phosphatase [Komagataeibacter swingsii]|uniref:phosphatase n=1 Tax=Komagataeibacter swingsii TaxID=215220 RepID=UPI001FC96E71|nr:phosphatase [Komagataeibacter swingsii]GBQ60074.1 phosphatase IIIC [Komagataeibacter swingsii DSM 16373]
MLVGPSSDLLTRDRLINARWTWGALNEPVLSTLFYFGADGRIQGFDSTNERTWQLDNGVLRLFDEHGTLFWRFDIVFTDQDRLTLISRPQVDPAWDTFFCLTEYASTQTAAAAQADALPPPGQDRPAGTGSEAIRLVIWDLDETFWQGTLSEGGVKAIARNLEIVRTLNQRGIVNAICSKNTFEEAQAKLQEMGIWDEFIFPRIAWTAKGPQIRQLVADIQLRPETVLFIDDNVMNLKEAQFYVPGLNVAEPDCLPGLLASPRLRGKPDPECQRRARYRVLEEKQALRSAQGDNEQFLRESGVRISFHTDIDEQFPRIHDLVNRTNQLNFTKRRWSEDIETARAQFHDEMNTLFQTNVGYVKVSDNFGNYGICGFYMIHHDRCFHFLFSCRTLNMGVEQFVWKWLGRPFMRIEGKVISDIGMPVDWITVVPDADVATAADTATQGDRPTLCIRGACDMLMTSNFLRNRVNTIEETNYPYQGWEIISSPRIAALHEELSQPGVRDLLARLPGIPPNRFETDIVTGRADVYVLSFSQESFHGLYRSRSTGIILPMGHYKLPYYLPEGPHAKFDYTTLSHDDLLARDISGITPEAWEFFRSEFEFVGGFNRNIFYRDVRHIFRHLKKAGKTVIVVGLNATVGRDRPILEFFGMINSIVQPMSQEFGFPYIDVNRFLHGEEDLAKDNTYGGPHFDRSVYKKISDEILNLVPAAA